MKYHRVRSQNISRPPSLLRLIFIFMAGKIARIASKSIPVQLPKRVGDYSLLSPLPKIGSKKNFLLGIYQNSHGQKALAKMCPTVIKDYVYYTFQNEITFYRVLNKAVRRIRRLAPNSFRDVKIPRLLDVFENKVALIVLFEYVEGQVADSLSDEEKVRVYFRAYDYLRFLGMNLTPEERAVIPTRSPLHLVLLYPLLLLKAMCTHPHGVRRMLKSAPVFLKAVPRLLQIRNFYFVHRDLHLRNILLSGRTNYIIDLQFCAFTVDLQELVTTLRYRWQEGDFYLYLCREIQKRLSDTRDFELLFPALLINSAIHGLTDGEFSRSKIDRWLDLLTLVSDSNFKLPCPSTKQYSLSVGIPAYNEGANIRQLVTSILEQSYIHAALKEIIVISDGSTDTTASEVRGINDQRIQLVTRARRLGINHTQNEIVGRASGDFLILLNADTFLRDHLTLENLLLPLLKDRRAALSGACISPLPSSGLFERVVESGARIRRFIFDRLDRSQNVYNCHGIARAFSKSFYKKLRWPEGCPEDAYSYFSCKKLGFRFVYAKKSVVFYRLPDNLLDHERQSRRFTDGTHTLENFFTPRDVQNAYRIPTSLLLYAVFVSCLKRPVSTVFYLLTALYIREYKKRVPIHHTKWEIATSTKRLNI